MDNAVDMYLAFGNGIDKHRTSVVSVTKWNLFINLIFMEWVNDKIPKLPFTGHTDHDLESFKVDTDDVRYSAIAPDSTNIFPIPYNGVVINGLNGVPIILPEYYQGISVMFKIGTPSTSEWKPVRLMIPEQRGHILNNPYEKPTDERLYFEFTGRVMRLYSVSPGTAMRLEYYRVPEKIEINTGGIVVTDVNITQKTRKEVVDRAVRAYLEEKANPRYQSYLNEMVIKNV